MKIIFATDAWEPQVNGVVRATKSIIRELEAMGHECIVIYPGLFKTFKCPFAHDVYLAYNIRQKYIAKTIKNADCVHICTEGTIGLGFSRYCSNNGISFTSSYHTNYPEYLKTHVGVPKFFTIRYLRWLNRKSSCVMVSTESLKNKLVEYGFKNKICVYKFGVDLDLFHPRPKTISSDGLWPNVVYVGRISKEKNIEAFLETNNCNKFLVGDGPDRLTLQNKYPNAKFYGALSGEALAQAYANADVFCFPSQTDTFGLVMIEALASGIPVAAFPVDGPKDIIDNQNVGFMSWDLNKAIYIANRCGRDRDCLAKAAEYTWENCAKEFLSYLVPYSSL